MTISLVFFLKFCCTKRYAYGMIAVNTMINGKGAKKMKTTAVYMPMSALRMRG